MGSGLFRAGGPVVVVIYNKPTLQPEKTSIKGKAEKLLFQLSEDDCEVFGAEQTKKNIHKISQRYLSHILYLVCLVALDSSCHDGHLSLARNCADNWRVFILLKLREQTKTISRQGISQSQFPDFDFCWNV